MVCHCGGQCANPSMRQGATGARWHLRANVGNSENSSGSTVQQRMPGRRRNWSPVPGRERERKLHAQSILMRLPCWTSYRELLLGACVASGVATSGALLLRPKSLRRLRAGVACGSRSVGTRPPPSTAGTPAAMSAPSFLPDFRFRVGLSASSRVSSAPYFCFAMFLVIGASLCTGIAGAPRGPISPRDPVGACWRATSSARTS
mmetsp:Transcript_1098/g.4365  ORF Transcript_1098/g.4365 Transcript_1098/m.4365 type:complete len:204 (+) Transcript_1098:1530-2141(+)